MSGAPLGLADVLEATSGVLEPAGPEAATSLQLDGVSIDSRTLEPGALFVAIRGPHFDGHDFLRAAAGRGARAAIVSRTVDACGLPLVRVDDTSRALAGLARHVRRRASLPVVGVTGSVGKTTTKEMAAALLATRGPVLKTEGNLNNQYGLPLTLLRLRAEHTAAVIELGMSAPGEIRALTLLAEPDVAVITKVAPVHLEFFPSVDAIAEAKAEILEGLAGRGTAVLNGDDPRIRRIGERITGRVVWFGRDARFDVSAGACRAGATGTRFELRVDGRTADVLLPLAGGHFVSNFLAAAGAAHALGVAPGAMAEAARSLKPARHRGEVVPLGEQVVLLDDCYNSSPDALAAAVDALSLLPGRRRVAIVGDMLELGQAGPALHRESGHALAARVDALIGIGPLAAEILNGARKAGSGPTVLHHFASVAEGVAAAVALVQPGDAVLVKASRGMRLELVVAGLLERFGTVGRTA